MFSSMMLGWMMAIVLSSSCSCDCSVQLISKYTYFTITKSHMLDEQLVVERESHLAVEQKHYCQMSVLLCSVIRTEGNHVISSSNEY